MINQANDKTFCGIKGVFRPPYWAFHDASCEIHDENYRNGGSWEDRLTADVGFLKHMLIDINKLPSDEKKKAAWSAAWYYIAVRMFGGTRFNYKKKRHE